jgi:hypothetical protein
MGNRPGETRYLRYRILQLEQAVDLALENLDRAENVWAGVL